MSDQDDKDMVNAALYLDQEIDKRVAMTLLRIFGDPNETVIVPSKINVHKDENGDLHQSEGALDYDKVRTRLMGFIVGAGEGDRLRREQLMHEDLIRQQQAAMQNAAAMQKAAQTAPPPSQAPLTTLERTLGEYNKTKEDKEDIKKKTFIDKLMGASF